MGVETLELKRLGRVAGALESYGSAAVNRATNTTLYKKAEQLYANGKEHHLVKPHASKVDAAEGFVKHVASVVYARAPSVLQAVDSTLDSGINIVSSPFAGVRATLHDSATSWTPAFTETKEKYFTLIESHVDSLKAKSVAFSSEAAEALRNAIEEGRARASTEARSVLDKVSAAWDSLVAAPAVAKVMEHAKPAVDKALEAARAAAATAKSKASATASYVQAQPAYAKHVEPRVSSLVAQPRVKLLIERVRPMVPAF